MPNNILIISLRLLQALVFSLIFHAYFGKTLILSADSQGYITFHDSLKNLSFIKNIFDQNIPYELAVRTPGYPIFLTIIHFFFGGNNSYDFILIGHFLLLFSLYLEVIWTFKSKLSFYPISACFFISAYYFGTYYAAVLTEWLAFCILVSIFCSVYIFIKKSDLTSFIKINVLICFAILTRPNLIILLCIPIFLLLIKKTNFSHFLFHLFSICYLPLILWLYINFCRFNVITLSPFLGYNLYGLTSMIGEAEHNLSDSEELKSFITHLNQTKTHPKYKERLEINKFYSENYPIEEFFHANLINSLNFNECRDKKNCNFYKMNSHYITYSTRVIKDNLTQYISVICKSTLEIFRDYKLFTVALFFVILNFSFKNLLFQDKAYFKLLCMAFVTHFISIFSISFVEIIYSRYLDLTFTPLLLIILIFLACSFKETVSRVSNHLTCYLRKKFISNF